MAELLADFFWVAELLADFFWAAEPLADFFWVAGLTRLFLGGCSALCRIFVGGWAYQTFFGWLSS